jgi:ribosomal protein S11
MTTNKTQFKDVINITPKVLPKTLDAPNHGLGAFAGFAFAKAKVAKAEIDIKVKNFEKNYDLEETSSSLGIKSDFFVKESQTFLLQESKQEEARPVKFLPEKKSTWKKSFTTTKAPAVKDASFFNFKTPKPLPIVIPQNKNLFCLISIKRTKNNTHATISSLFGENKTRWSISAGQLKLPGGRRKTRLSQRLIYKSSLEKAVGFGYKYTAVHCKGTRGSKTRIFRSFGKSLKVLLIKDTTGAAYNGCRPRKIRRV